MSQDPTFDATEASKSKLPTFGTMIQDFAFRSADDFIDLGQSPLEAGSIVANAFIRAAWLVAGCGAVADDTSPDPERFRRRVDEVLASIKFTDPDEEERT